MKSLKEMSYSELEQEFSIYAAENGMDREFEYDFETDFATWLKENEIEIEEE